MILQVTEKKLGIIIAFVNGRPVTCSLAATSGFTPQPLERGIMSPTGLLQHSPSGQFRCSLEGVG
jgi:hypothetical protein